MKITVIPVTPFQQNCCLIWNEYSRQGAVLDPGGDERRILAAIDREQVAVTKIVLTHGHIDHAAGAAGLRDTLRSRAGRTDGIPIEGPDERDRFLLENFESQAERWGMRGARNVTPDRWLTEGDRVEIAGTDFEVLHCPGHTPGHLVFVDRPGRLALVGDVLFRGSIGRTDFDYGDHAALIDAITRKLLPLGDDVTFICGHGPGSTIGAERAGNPFLN